MALRARCAVQAQCSATGAYRPVAIGTTLSALLAPKVGAVRPDRFGDVGLRQVAVMSLDHARVGVAKVLRDDEQRGSGHDREAGPRMTQRMEVERRQDFRAFARRLQRAMLVRLAPRRTVSLHKDPLIAGAADAQPLE